jgi:hypothetical protein
MAITPTNPQSTADPHAHPQKPSEIRDLLGCAGDPIEARPSPAVTAVPRGGVL